MGLDQADHDVVAFPLQRLARWEHRVGLADAGRDAEKHLEPAARLLAHQRQQGVGVGPAVKVTLLRHVASASTIGAIIAPCLRREFSGRRQSVQRHVEPQHVDAGLADQPEDAPVDMGLDEAAHLVLRQIARLGDRGDLRQGVGRRDVRVEAGAEVVTASAGIGPVAPAARLAATSAFTRSSSFCEVGPRFEPVELAAL